MATAALFETSITSLPLLHRGKVRDIYAVDENHLLIIQTDRVSAFDVILPTPIPEKGKILTKISRFWFDKLAHIIPNHLTDITPESVVSSREQDQVSDRAFIVRKLKPLPVEAIVRGYISGSGWKDYQRSGTICGIALPAGLREADKIPDGAIFTPSTKAEAGSHDENISYSVCEQLLGVSLAAAVSRHSIALYTAAADYALTRSIIIADTKFEFGLDEANQLYLIDEALTPDSSRFWPAESYRPGKTPPSYDKQFIRDWLEQINWNKTPPAPPIPEEVLVQTIEKYQAACRVLTQ
ncbi:MULTISPECIES: phosphoribosylaminoimidazolesuccinocarboxamide synthase [Nitrosomonas]|uniref:Phosphoribosylaminoimidazole-succinocarboxamide synthase n=1 Tax=Nitrosomonas europaea (strain ATCC 19718 / CIP 103999 / KCTC 2705 / NBRC 14298) TaxID=228410 RepID=PUR7_NITEU|nr:MULTISPECIES: phosphoribosylaminoimidazolesuccinocarboxamide synthase [Nitrosomonas]Q82W32.1 RecName: Full=Phosphoribosylaminoimidazole-succinocarboxamide synthase; AltName: Full=SAICAR synthetase [Nitrosomonas europaea ATCC 19718]CAD84777.1 SAICAR synthetase [Nitrosomonas europaea ATCC 19718]SDW16710.1 phosphoribosylaminoimidazole-succinocarboxamide synthase [Nitrosomonas europaea]SES78181.1 phosphoribosylaminoimidazole-succinocarboxamide synthase [Nitrosomonas europaea]SJZ34377.1 phosphor